MKNKTEFGGIFNVQCVRDGKVIWEENVHNVVVDEGLKQILNAGIRGSGTISNWYVSIYENNYVPLSGDTGATIAGAGKAGAFTDYQEAARPAYTTDPASDAPVTITNSNAKATFTITSAAVIYGAFVISASAKDASGDAASTLLSASRFASSRSVAIDDQLLITYEFVASNS